MDAPAERRLHVAVGAAEALGRFHVVADAGIALEIGLDVLAGLLLRDAELGRQAEGGDAVDDAEIDRLGLAPDHRVHALDRDAEHLGGGNGVDVVAVAEGALQRLDVGDMRQQAQLDLRIVGRQQGAAFLGDEGLADLAALLGAHRDVLQVGIGRGQPAGGGAGHVVGGVDAPVVGVDLLQQRVGIGALELGELAPVEHAGGQLVLARQLLENVRAGGVGAGLAGLGAAGQLQLVEQHLAQLLGRADVEGMAGQSVDLLLQLDQARGEIGRQALELGLVDLDALFLHVGQYGDQRPLAAFVDRGHAFADQPRLQLPPQPVGDVGVLGRIGHGLLQRHLLEGDAGAAGAGDFVVGNRLVLEEEFGELVHAVPVLAAFEHEGQQHGVVDRFHVDAGTLTAKHLEVVFHVLTDFQHRLVLQHGLQDCNDLVERQLARQQFARAAAVEVERALVAGLAMADRHVGGAPVRQRQRHADQIGLQLVERIGLGVDGDLAVAQGLGHPQLQRRGVGDGFVGEAADLRQVVLDDPLGLLRRRRRALAVLLLFVEGGDAGLALRLALDAVGQIGHGRAFGRIAEFLARARQDALEALELQPRDQDGGIGIGLVQRIGVLRHRRVVVELHQLLGDARQLGIGLQRFAALGLLDLAGALEQRFQAAVFGDQLGGGLDADAGHAGHVVGRIAGQRLHVDDLFRRDAEFLHNLGRADRTVLDRVQHRDAIAHQLHQILVGRHDGDFGAHRARLVGISGDQVVGLIAR